MLHELRSRTLRALLPPPRLKLSDFAEREIVLPKGVSALPGRVRLWLYQRGIAAAIVCRQNISDIWFGNLREYLAHLV